ncbi:hypothetical protein [Paraburkholderia caballeronis]|uniref:Uncharacterized protein n=1 Tax=Paraburkholderia caballeronis TaxID=416943 RepID=A0A1H7L2K6_9BURK|nr:hypothetical protein [Paraburkholderia caballeronis]PXW28261.1 hypothetical protein C7403_102153 [Paraburkholderia caballeronis]PXX03627.1 hypothetical protein C7407_102153 [Paraburkholderia caballeronis]RAK04371.1 hypothetical protein C7409_102153 [Paraburkholderia caballeronis]SED82896.1 hypothetical protein SAMN05445871_4026 [Paraburkholderia caballeronis]SEK93030.1 hypothetical protein SAMN05192542_104153 [Paraburkholderia caballeronis]
MAGSPFGSDLLSNPLLATLAPDQQQNLIQLQQRQMLGQALLSQGMQPLDAPNATAGGVAFRQSPLNGIANLAKSYLGATMSRDAAGQQAQLMAQMYGNAFGAGPQGAAQPQQGTAAPSTDAGGMTGGQSGPGVQSYPVPGIGAPTGPQLGAALAGASPAIAAHGGPLTLPGKTPAESMQIFATVGPQAYGQMLANWGAPTDATKMANAAGIDPAQANAGALFKANYVPPVSGRPGGYMKDPVTGQLTWLPTVPAGAVPQFNANGQFTGVAPMPGAAEVAQGQAYAHAAGEGSALPYAGVDAQGNPLPVTNRTAAATQGAGGAPAAPLPLRNNNPGAVSPGGAVASYPDMQTGLAKMDANLASYAGQPGTGTLSGVITKWVGSPPNAPAYIKDVSTRLGISPDTPVDLTNPAQRQAIGTAIMLHENGPAAVFAGQPQASTRGASVASGGPVFAAAPQGATAAANTLATNNANSYKSLTDMASTSADRANTLDNMLALAQGTTQYGPGWSGRLDRIAEINKNLPSNLQLGNDNVANAQVLQKYMSNLAQQYQKALGGTGSDLQLSTVLKGTPTPDMMNKAMVEVIPKLKAQELALQAKANAADQWVAQNGNNPSNLNQFESLWRKNYDPRIYQMQQMTPPERQAFLKTQPDAANLRTKTAAALQNGWVQ